MVQTQEKNAKHATLVKTLLPICKNDVFRNQVIFCELGNISPLVVTFSPSRKGQPELRKKLERERELLTQPIKREGMGSMIFLCPD